MANYSFKNDYSEGCHPNILKALSEHNNEQFETYGDDIYSREAKIMLQEKMENPNANIYFVSGGTQANLIVIASILRPHEAVICANSGHIFVHEAGAIEATGHKVLIINSENGKVNIEGIKKVLEEHELAPHMVKPKLVYISNSTEIGTIYKKEELKDLSEFCKSKNLYLFMDGARLGSALSSEENDLTMSDISNYTDVFYIGGTKNGVLFGEAIVINNDDLKEDFGFHLKQRGALLAKGYVIGLQFLEIFKDDLYFTLGKHANLMAKNIVDAVKEKGYIFLTEPATNQIFPILPNKTIEELSKKYDFYVWQKIDTEKSAIRIVTSWATPQEAINEFIEDLRSLS